MKGLISLELCKSQNKQVNGARKARYLLRGLAINYGIMAHSSGVDTYNC